MMERLIDLCRYRELVTSCKSRWSNVSPMCNEETEMGMREEKEEK